MTHDVFISYSTKDNSAVGAVCEALEGQSIKCWLAARDIPPSEEWGAAIVDAIKSSRVMLVIFSSNANKSRHIMRELNIAVNQGLAVLPVKIEPVPPVGALEYLLGMSQWLDACSPPLESHMGRLTDAVRKLLPQTEERVEAPSTSNEADLKPPDTPSIDDASPFHETPSATPTGEPAPPVNDIIDDPLARLHDSRRRHVVEETARRAREARFESLQTELDAAISRQSYSAALRTAKVMLTLKPEDKETQNLVADLHRLVSSGQPVESPLPPKPVPARDSRMRRSELLQLSTQLRHYMSAKRWDAVAATAERILKLNPDDTTARQALAAFRTPPPKLNPKTNPRVARPPTDRPEAPPPGFGLKGPTDSAAAAQAPELKRLREALRAHLDGSKWADVEQAADAILRLAPNDSDAVQARSAARRRRQAGDMRVACLTGHSDRVSAVAFSGDGRFAASGGADDTVRIWDVAGGAELQRLAGHRDGVRTVAWCASAPRILSGGGDGAIRLWDAESGAELACLPGHGDRVLSVAFSPDGRLAVSSGMDETVRVWDLIGKNEWGRLEGHQDIVYCAVVAPDGRRAATAGHDGTVRIWDLETRRELLRTPPHRWAMGVAFTPASDRLVLAGYGDCSLRLWDATSGREMRCFNGHTEGIRAVAYSPDGRLALSSAGDNSVRLWNTSTSQELACLEGHTGWVDSVAFSPDNTLALTGGSDGAVRVWRMPTH